MRLRTVLAGLELPWELGGHQKKGEQHGTLSTLEADGNHIRKGVRFYLTPFLCRSTPLRVTVSNFYCSCASGLDGPGLPPRLFIF